MSDRKAYLLSDSTVEEIRISAEAATKRYGGGTAEAEVAFRKFSTIYSEMMAEPVPTAQEMCWALWERTRELNAQGFPHLQALAMAFGNYIDAHPEIEQPKE